LDLLVIASYSAEKQEVTRERRPWHGDEENHFLKGLIDGMRCGIVCVDRDGHLVLLNDLGAAMLDISPTPQPGVPAEQALADHPQILTVLEDSFAMSSLPNRAELELTTGKGESRTVGFTLSHVTGVDGQPAGAAMFFKDLTQIEQKEGQQRLKDRLAALGQMAASLAHEIRNPLAAINVTCSLIRRRLSDDERSREMLDKVTTEVTRLNGTITSSLEFVRPVSLSLAPSELPPVLAEAIDVATGRAASPGVTVETDFDEVGPAFAMDRSQLRQVFENLILNAIEAVGESGVVRVEAERVPAPTVVSVPYRPDEREKDPWQTAEHHIVVRVMDSGPGIAEDERDRVFYPFFTTKKNGSGVGLSMVKKIVDRHRGLIDIDNAPQGGARITVRLPMIDGIPED
jgi:signal transduction histidine kinase